MNRSTRSINRIIIAVILLMCLFSCAKKGVPGGMNDMSYSTMTADGAAPRQAEAFSPQSGDRLLIKSASLEVSVPSLPEASAQVLKIVQKAEGYIQDTATEKDYTRMSLRIPAGRLVPVLDDIARLGKEITRNISSVDVTEQVADMNAALKNKIMLRDRLRALLERAKDVKDVLAVETELTRLQTEIDSLEGQLKRMRGDINYSVINLELRPMPQKEILGPLGYLYVGTKWVITKLFVIRPGGSVSSPNFL